MTESPFLRGHLDAYQDKFENTPFASVGGLDKRTNMQAPSYVKVEEREEYLKGYERACWNMFGDDWRTCTFAWQAAVKLEGKT